MALTRAKATLLMKAMLESVANEQEARKKLRDRQVTKDKTVERHVLDEAVRIVEDGGRRQARAKVKVKAKGKTKRSTLRSCTAFPKTTTG